MFGRSHAPEVQRKKPKSKIARSEETGEQTHTTGNTPHHEHGEMLALHRTVGNRALVNRAVVSRVLSPSIQRALPDSRTLISVAGEPKKKSTRYRAILAGLDNYREFVTSVRVDPNPRVSKELFDRALKHLDVVNDEVTYFRETHSLGTMGKTKKKRGAIFGLLEQVQAERVGLIKAQSRLAGGITGGERITIQQAIAGGGTANGIKLDSDSEVGSERGGSSEVTEYSQDGMEGFFKKNKSEFKYKSGEEAEEGQMQTILEKGKLTARQREIDLEIKRLTQDKSTDHTEEINALTDEMLFVAQKGEDIFNQWNADNNETQIGVETVGIDPTDTHMAARDVAMSRIDKLLGANVIANAEMALAEDPNVPEGVPGSFMEKAQGRQMLSVAQDPRNMDKRAPEVMRQLSRLQLIDLLCFQVDRNMKNVFISTDMSGNVQKITGIDNDFALGTNTNLDVQVQELPGISKYVDAELAQRIIDLEPKVMRDLVSDLLTTAEIDALITRLTKLQNELKRLKSAKKLLMPDQWTRAISEKLITEDKSYFAKFMKTK